jgi:hypothetical protein
LLLHVPPGSVLLNIAVVVLHIGETPDIVPATGSGITVTNLVAVDDPQPLVFTKLIVTIPADTPVNTPVPLAMIAIVGSLLLHVPTPPPVGLLYTLVPPTHANGEPEIVAPIAGKAEIVTE